MPKKITTKTVVLSFKMSQTHKQKEKMRNKEGERPKYKST